MRLKLHIQPGEGQRCLAKVKHQINLYSTEMYDRIICDGHFFSRKMAGNAQHDIGYTFFPRASSLIPGA